MKSAWATNTHTRIVTRTITPTMVIILFCKRITSHLPWHKRILSESSGRCFATQDGLRQQARAPYFGVCQRCRNSFFVVISTSGQRSNSIQCPYRFAGQKVCDIACFFQEVSWPYAFLHGNDQQSLGF